MLLHCVVLDATRTFFLFSVVHSSASVCLSVVWLSCWSLCCRYAHFPSTCVRQFDEFFGGKCCYVVSPLHATFCHCSSVRAKHLLSTGLCTNLVTIVAIFFLSSWRCHETCWCCHGRVSADYLFFRCFPGGQDLLLLCTSACVDRASPVHLVALMFTGVIGVMGCSSVFCSLFFSACFLSGLSAHHSRLELAHAITRMFLSPMRE
jgi:hypothetical protein